LLPFTAAAWSAELELGGTAAIGGAASAAPLPNTARIAQSSDFFIRAPYAASASDIDS
jgi:hypothetical protein